MNKVARIFSNIFGYFSSLGARWKRRRKNKKDDPFIYPHF